MSNKQDLLLRLDSQFNDKGFKNAEQSAKVLERELAKQEAAERQLANLQMAAFREDQKRQAARLSSMESLGKGFTAVGVLAAAGLGVAAKAAIDWESAWAGVTKTADGTQEEVAALEGQLRDLATSLPSTHEEIAAVAEAAGQLGVKARDIAGFTKTMIDLGVSTNLSAEEAATGLAQLGNIMGVLPSQADRAGAALVALGNDGASTEADILAMSLRIAGAGKTIGLSEAQVMGYANALASMGIEAEAGGSAISRTMVSVAQAVDEGGASLDTFAQVAGMTTDQFAKKFRTDAAGAVAAFVEGLGRMQKSGQSTFGVLDDLGLSEVRVRDARSRASNAGDLLTKSINLGSQAWEANTALVDEANKRYETTESRLKIARNELNDAAIDIGANLLPALAGAADRVGFLAETFHTLPEPVKEALTVLGGTVAVVGLVGGAALILIPKLVAMNATLAATGPAGAAAARGLSAAGAAMMGPWGLAIAAGTLLLGVWAEKQFEAKQRVEELARTLDEQTGAVTQSTKAWAVDALAKDGTLKAAKDLGISLNDLTDAMLGNEDAAARVSGRISEIQGSLAASGASADATGIQYADLGDAMKKVQDAVSGGNEDLRKARDETLLKAEALGKDAAASENAAGAAGVFNAAQVTTQQDAERARKEIDDLIKSIESYGDTVNNALDATSSYEAALDDAAEAVEENGKTANKARTAIDLHTKAGRDNDKALREIATSALKAATANFENGRSVKAVTGDVMKARAEFITMAQKMGLSKKAAEELANKLGLTKANVDGLSEAVRKTPTSHTTDMRVKTKEALEALELLQRRVNGLRGNDVRVNVRYVESGQTGGGITKDADGSIHAFASGGFAPIGTKQPQIRLAGGAGMTWAEQGAGAWEAFISGHPAKRDRSEQIWWETGRRLGVVDQAPQVQPVTVQGGPTFQVRFEVHGDGAEKAAEKAIRDFEHWVVTKL